MAKRPIQIEVDYLLQHLGVKALEMLLNRSLVLRDRCFHTSEARMTDDILNTGSLLNELAIKIEDELVRRDW